MSDADSTTASPVVLDDQLALYAALGLLALPPSIIGVPVTTYAWQQRMLGAFVVGRTNHGRLRHISTLAGLTREQALDAVGRPRVELLEIADPTMDPPTPADITRQLPPPRER